MKDMTYWQRSHRADPAACRIADRHYSRQKHGSPQFVPPGRCVVYRHGDEALWVSSAQEYVRHRWPGAWICTVFRNEGARLSSELVREAIAHTVADWGTPPPEGFITFVDAGKVRHKRDPGRCFLRAGFVNVGETVINRLIVLHLDPAAFPDPLPVVGPQQTLWEVL